MIMTNDIAHQHSGNTDGFGGKAMDAWPAGEVGGATREWAYTVSEQNEDDLFLMVPPSSRKHKSHQLRQFKDHCQQLFNKLMHQGK